jgi:ketosteroid isomerase-like protein
MVALYEDHAVVHCDNDRVIRGRDEIRSFYAEVVASGRLFYFSDQRPALISGDLALTSTRSHNGNVTSEVARQQDDGTWLWVIDRFSVT